MMGRLKNILESLLNASELLEVVFPVHPRTRARISQLGIALDKDKLQLLDPVPYIEFLALQRRATAVITDSGGIQKEPTYPQVPCLTLRRNTERPITVTMGTNTLVGQDRRKLAVELSAILAGRAKRGTVPPLWDGHAGERIADVLQRL